MDESNYYIAPRQTDGMILSGNQAGHRFHYFARVLTILVGSLLYICPSHGKEENFPFIATITESKDDVIARRLRSVYDIKEYKENLFPLNFVHKLTLNKKIL